MNSKINASYNTASFNSFSNIPFSSMVNNGLLSMSPFVLIVTISNSIEGFDFLNARNIICSLSNGKPTPSCPYP